MSLPLVPVSRVLLSSFIRTVRIVSLLRRNSSLFTSIHVFAILAWNHRNRWSKSLGNERLISRRIFARCDNWEHRGKRIKGRVCLQKLRRNELRTMIEELDATNVTLLRELIKQPRTLFCVHTWLLLFSHVLFNFYSWIFTAVKH